MFCLHSFLWCFQDLKFWSPVLGFISSWSLVMQLYFIAFIVLMVFLFIFGSYQSWYAFIFIAYSSWLKVLVLVLGSLSTFIFLYNIIQYSFQSIQIHPNVISIHNCSFHYKNVHVHTKITFWLKFATIDFWSIVDFLVNQLTEVNWPSFDPLIHISIHLSKFHHQKPCFPLKFLMSMT